MAKKIFYTNAARKQAASGHTILLTMTSGLALTACFPPIGFSFMSWFALVPLLKAIENQTALKAFRLGMITGTVHYLSLIYWIIVVLAHYGGLSPLLSVGPYLLLCLYLGLYFGIFAFLAIPLKTSRFFVLWLACFWVGLEYLRATLLTGFPWCLLGYSQFKNLLLIQISDTFGVYGLSFLIVAANGLIYCLLFRTPGFRKRSPGPPLKERLFLETALIVLLLGATVYYGHYRLSEGPSENGPIKSAKCVVIQGSIDQSVKWDPNFQRETLNIYKRLTHDACNFRPDLVVWPETAVPFFFQDNADLSAEVFSIVRECGCGLLFGSPAYKRVDDQVTYYNRAYLISSQEPQIQYYDKVHLVPFGEYVPLKSVLSFVNRLVPAAGDFSAGDKTDVLRQRDLSLGVLICFESIFPDIARNYARQGANILVNITNDAWFGKTSAPYQLLAMASFRAVENRIPLIRAANTGFSAFIGPQGKILECSDWFRQETLKIDLEVRNSHQTIYARVGDVFSISLLGLTIIRVLYFLRKKEAATSQRRYLH